MGKTTRAHVVGSNRPIRLNERSEQSGVFPLLVIYLKAASATNQKDFQFWLNRLGLEANLVHPACNYAEGEGRIDAYEVWGSIDGLFRLTTFRFIAGYHLPMSARIPVTGMGNGSEKFKPSPRFVEGQKAEDKKDKNALACAKGRKQAHHDGNVGIAQTCEKARVNALFGRPMVECVDHYQTAEELGEPRR